MNAVFIPKLPNRLGYAGLLPFVLLAALLWLAPGQWHASLAFALTGYAAVILSFMGAVHWGLGMAVSGNAESRQLGLSVVPPLAAWLALMLPTLWSLAVLTACFGLLCLADVLAAKKRLTPDWYPGLRIPLTIVVMLSLISASLAMY